MSVGVESFNGKAAAYASGRPGYSDAALDFIASHLNLDRAMRVADVGAGTGILTRALAQRFERVVGVEPNQEMREALGAMAIHGTAEQTNLEDGSIDAIFAGQAFHWFDVDGARSEFLRILRPPAKVALLWNNRDSRAGIGAEALEQILRSLRNKSDSLEPNAADIHRFFRDGSFVKSDFSNFAGVNRSGLQSMVLSRSYAPKKGDAGYEPLVNELAIFFDRFSSNDEFLIPYVTEVYCGRLR